MKVKQKTNILLSKNKKIKLYEKINRKLLQNSKFKNKNDFHTCNDKKLFSNKNKIQSNNNLNKSYFEPKRNFHNKNYNTNIASIKNKKLQVKSVNCNRSKSVSRIIIDASNKKKNKYIIKRSNTSNLIKKKFNDRIKLNEKQPNIKTYLNKSFNATIKKNNKKTNSKTSKNSINNNNRKNKIAKKNFTENQLSLSPIINVTPIKFMPSNKLFFSENDPMKLTFGSSSQNKLNNESEKQNFNDNSFLKPTNKTKNRLTKEKPKKKFHIRPNHEIFKPAKPSLKKYDTKKNIKTNNNIKTKNKESSNKFMTFYGMIPFVNKILKKRNGSFCNGLDKHQTFTKHKIVIKRKLDETSCIDSTVSNVILDSNNEDSSFLYDKNIKNILQDKNNIKYKLIVKRPIAECLKKTPKSSPKLFLTHPSFKNLFL